MTNQQSTSWYSATQLVGLPGMPGTKQGVIKIANREAWEKRPRSGRGGGWEYPIEALPGETRDHLYRQGCHKAFSDEKHAIVAHAKPSTPAASHSRLPVAASDADAEQLIVRDARLGILNAISRAVMTQGITHSRSIAYWIAGISEKTMAPLQLFWCAIANDKNGFRWTVDWQNDVPVAVAEPGQDVHEYASRLSRETLFRWARVRKEGGDDALIPGKRQKDMRVPAWAPYFLANLQRPQKNAMSSAWKKMGETLKAQGWREHTGSGSCKPHEFPGYSQCVRWYNEKYSKLDAKRGKNTGSSMNPHKFCHTRTSEGMWPLLEVHSDGWNTHFTAPHPVSGKFVTFEVWHSHDVATRKAYVSERSIGLSESMIVILGALHAVCAEDGEPIVWQTDNTGSVKNDRVEFDPVTSIAARRGMTIVHNLPGNSQANGIAENFNQYLDARAKELSTYQGKGMDSLSSKRVLRITQKMTKAMNLGDADEVARLHAEAERAGCGIVFRSYREAVDWIKTVVSEFNARPHRSLPKMPDPITGKKRHMSPNEMLSKFVAEGWERQPLAGDDLADAFRVHERKTIRRGRISIMGQDYHHPEMDHINGENVMAAYDIHDGQRVWIKNLDGALLFEAPIYQDRPYRVRSFYEIALEKRADNQIKRLDTKKDAVEAQRPGAILESPVVVEMAIPGKAVVPIQHPVTEPSTSEKPNLATMGDYSRLTWLADHPEDWTPEYRAYCAMAVKRGSSTVREALEEYDLWGEIEGFFEGASASCN